VHYFRIGLASLVTLVWLADYAIAFYTPEDAHEGLTGLMAIVLGWAFGGTVWDTVKAKVREADRDEEPPPVREHGEA
jgi:hypothetical protein